MVNGSSRNVAARLVYSSLARAQYMLTRKLLGNWWCWIAVDLAYIVMYASQQLYLTAALQPLFIAMCVAGWRRWRASLRNATLTADVAPVVAR
jgi:nicotinamide mononucleotide transporter